MLFLTLDGMISEMALLVETMTMEQRNKIWQDRKAARQICPLDTVERRQILEMAENTAALWEIIEMDIMERKSWLRIGWTSCLNKYSTEHVVRGSEVI
jgi:hypothetical protein